MTTPASPDGDFSTLFNFLPIGAYRSLPDGRALRANRALVAFNGYSTEAQLLEAAQNIGVDWYVQPDRRAEFQRLLERDGFVRGFVSEVYRYRTRERVWVSENAHKVRDASGRVLFYEGTVEDITDQIHNQMALRDSEERLRLITSQVPGAVFAVYTRRSGEREYRYVSSGIRDIYGFEPEDLMRNPSLFERYLHPDDRALFERDGRAIQAGPVVLETEFRVVLPGGRVRWVCNRSCPASVDAEGVLRVGVQFDITDRKEAEAALHASEVLWKLALESAGDGVWDWNPSTGEGFVSPGIKAILGYPEGADVDLEALVHPDDVAQTFADRQAHFEGRAPAYRNEHRLRHRDGSWKWVLSRGMVIARDEQGRPLRMVGTHTDITEHKQAEALHRALEAQLRESQKMEAIGTLAGGVAHDFNNLLAAILGNLVLAREDIGPNHPAQESLSEINRAAIRARQLVQQILTFSRRQTQEMVRQPLTPLVSDALRLLRSLLPAGVRLVAHLPEHALPVQADATQIQQVLMNLCTNAWQSLAGRADGSITVALDDVRLDASRALRMGALAGGRYARLSVADNGPGMDEETQRRVFEPFFTTKGPGEGTGLGLAVVHGIVKAHQGAIELHSRPGQGARFDIYLPLAPDAGPDGDDDGASPEPASPAQPLAEAPAAPPPGKHVIYIDDYEALVFLVGRLLRKRGYRVSTFGTGAAALEWVRAHPQEPVDLVVTDQNMPGFSGVEVARRLRQIRPRLRVAVVSGHVSDELLAEAAAAGVYEVMGKQDRMDVLGESIRVLLETPAGENSGAAAA